MCLTFIQRIRKNEDLYQYVLQNEHSPVELQQMVLKLLRENRSLLKECHRIARKLAQCMKLVFILEDTLYLTMSQEVLKDTVTLPDCLRKIKRYLDITKKFVERTESLVTVNYNLDEASGRIISESLQEMETIKRVVKRVNSKLLHSKCENGTDPVESNQQSSYASNSNLHKKRPGRPRKYSRWSSNNTDNKQHEKYKKNITCSSVEQSETEDNTTNNVSHEMSKKNEPIQYRRQSIDSHEESSSDDESQSEDSFYDVSAASKQRCITKRKSSSGLEQDLAESRKGQKQVRMYKSNILKLQELERSRQSSQSSHDKSSSEEEMQVTEVSKSVKPRKRGRGRPKQTSKRRKQEYSEAHWHWYWSGKRDVGIKPCSVVLIDVLEDPAAECFIEKLKQNKLSDTLKECEAFSGREEFIVLDTVGQSDKDFEASSHNENSEREIETYTINDKGVSTLQNIQPYSEEVADEHGNSDHEKNFENIGKGRMQSKCKEIRPVNCGYPSFPMATDIADSDKDIEPKNKKSKPMHTLTSKSNKLPGLFGDNFNHTGTENDDKKGKNYSKTGDRPTQSSIPDCINLSFNNHDSEETVIESLGHSQVDCYKDTISDEDNCFKAHGAATNEDEGSYVEEKKGDPDGKGPLTLPLPAFAKRCRGPYTPPGSPPVTDEFNSEDDFE